MVFWSHTGRTTKWKYPLIVVLKWGVFIWHNGMLHLSFILVFFMFVVFTKRPDNCNSRQSIAATSRDQILSSNVGPLFDCKDSDVPLILEAKELQRINITFVDFNWRVKLRGQSQERCPIKYGHMVDTNTNDIVPLCGGLVRERQLFLSESHRVQLVLARNGQNHENNNFLIKFKGIANRQ